MTSVNRVNVPVGSTFTNPLRVVDVKDSEHLQAAKFSSSISTGSGQATKSNPKEAPLKSAHYRAFIIAIVQDKVDLTGKVKLCWLLRTGDDFPSQLNFLVQGTNLAYSGDLVVKSWSSFKQGDTEVPAGSHRYIFLHHLIVNDVTVTQCLPQNGFHGMLDGESKEDFERRSASLQLALQQQQPVLQQQNPVQQQQQAPQQQQPVFQQQPNFQQPLQQLIPQPGFPQPIPQPGFLQPIPQPGFPQPIPQPGFPQPGFQQQQQQLPDSLTTTVSDVPDNPGRKRKPDQGGPSEQGPSETNKRQQPTKPSNGEGPSKSTHNPHGSATDMEMI